MLHSVRNKCKKSKKSQLANSILKDTANIAAKIYNRTSDVSVIRATFLPEWTSVKGVWMGAL